MEAVVQHKPRKDKGIPVKVDGRVAAALTRLACSQTPTEEPSWTLSVLGDSLVQLGVVESISRETVRKTLKKLPQTAPEGTVASSTGAERYVRVFP
ncbi:hypothetical protein [Deinococcus sp.]|uniref:hypothetical protein n=1 Tax=Deinococcus sp. TaxID=47478 RepID=UPI003CC52E3D